MSKKIILVSDSLVPDTMDEAIRFMAVAKLPKKTLVGVDIYLDWKNGSPDELAEKLNGVSNDLELSAIYNRNIKVWPNSQESTAYACQWKCRFMVDTKGGAKATPAQIITFLACVNGAGLDYFKTENLYVFEGISQTPKI